MKDRKWLKYLLITVAALYMTKAATAQGTTDRSSPVVISSTITMPEQDTSSYTPLSFEFEGVSDTGTKVLIQVAYPTISRNKYDAARRFRQRAPRQTHKRSNVVSYPENKITYDPSKACTPFPEAGVPASGRLLIEFTGFVADLTGETENRELGILGTNDTWSYVTMPDQDSLDVPIIQVDKEVETGEYITPRSRYVRNGIVNTVNWTLGDLTYTLGLIDYMDIGKPKDGVWHSPEGIWTTLEDEDNDGIYETEVLKIRRRVTLYPDFSDISLYSEVDTLAAGQKTSISIEPLRSDSSFARLPLTTELVVSYDSGSPDTSSDYGLLNQDGGDSNATGDWSDILTSVPIQNFCDNQVYAWAAKISDDDDNNTPALKSTEDLLVDNSNIDLKVEVWHNGSELIDGSHPFVSNSSINVLRQNGDLVPSIDDGGYLMISKVNPEILLPKYSASSGNPLPFGNGDYSNRLPVTNIGEITDSFYDPHTYRFEGVGIHFELADGVKFRLRREGSYGSLPFYETGIYGDDEIQFVSYDSVCQEVNSDHACRTNSFVRFVSNSAPAFGYPPRGTPKYDDQVAGNQTLKLDLLDKVDIYPIYEYMEEEVLHTYELFPNDYRIQVGATSQPNNIDNVLYGRIKWNLITSYDYAHDYNTEPGLITDRISEDWAQASILFRAEPNVSLIGPNAVNGLFALGSDDHEIEGSGRIYRNITCDGNSVILDISYSDKEKTIDVLKRTINVLKSLFPDNEFYRYIKNTSRGDLSEVYLVSSECTIKTNTTIEHSPTNFDLRSLESLDLHSLRFTQKNRALSAFACAIAPTEPGIITTYVVPLAAIQSESGNRLTRGLGGSDDPYYCYNNVLFLTTRSSDLIDDYAMVAGHEIGHVLLDGPYTSSISASSGHDNDEYNLMYDRVSVIESDTDILPPFPDVEEPDTNKRLRAEQQLAVRCESGIWPQSECPSIDFADQKETPLLLPIE